MLKKALYIVGIIVVIILLIVLINNAIENRIFQKKMLEGMNAATQPSIETGGSTPGLSPSNKIKELSNELTRSLSSSFFGIIGNTEELLAQVLQLETEELRQLHAEYLEANGTKLYHDIDELIMVHTDIDNKVLQKLKTLQLD